MQGDRQNYSRSLCRPVTHKQDEVSHHRSDGAHKVKADNGDCAFSVSAQKVWNYIPDIIKCCVDLNAFKRNLNTYLFKRYFNE